ncbi:MAG: hypothetical protein VYD87_04195 [Pseudomonadota bacterium]|nr:hypothetical protein [Pseudomonadota bacterium]MEE3100571.1 hypothetical protein [Pseudomonadota bacterium]
MFAIPRADLAAAFRLCATAGTSGELCCRGCGPLTDRLCGLKGSVVRPRVAIDAPGKGARLTP